jgi:hypothetical protein
MDALSSQGGARSLEDVQTKFLSLRNTCVAPFENCRTKPSRADSKSNEIRLHQNWSQKYFKIIACRARLL